MRKWERRIRLGMDESNNEFNTPYLKNENYAQLEISPTLKYLHGFCRVLLNSLNAIIREFWNWK